MPIMPIGLRTAVSKSKIIILVYNDDGDDDGIPREL